MRIKSLRVSGFKSFCHAVELGFTEHGTTVVVGPNGCGKSNVVDAIRWVLGEQRPKHLRGGSMEDVIFAGSAFQKPLGMAEVTLTFANPTGDTLSRFNEYSEIAVTRRLYRSGESVYMINKTPVRLMDIRELFMDTGIGSTGYSIVEQGRVGEIVSAKPAERRTLIDDAAGIVKYRTKRQAAERRLEETGQNLLRVNDVLGELQDREEGLREHVENAQTYLDLQSQCRSTEQNLLVVRWYEVGLQEEKLDAKVAEEQQRQQDLQTEKSVVETDLQRLSLEQTQRTDQLTRKREALFQKERDIQEAENQRRLEQQTIENAREQQGRQEQELNELQERLARLEGAVQDASGQFETLTEKREVLETEVAEIERARTEQHDVLQEVTSVLQSLQKRLLKLHMELTNQTNQRNFLEERLTQFQERLQRLQGQRDANAELVRQAEGRAHASRQQLGSLQAKQTTLETRVEALGLSSSQQESDLDELDQRIRELRFQHGASRSRLESLQQIQGQYEDFSDSVQQFMERLREQPQLREQWGLRGLLADHLIAEPEWLEQVAPVLSEVLDWIVVERSAQLPELAGFCQQEGFGTLRFLALDRLPSVPEATLPGVSLNDHLSYREPLEEWGRRFFQRFRMDESGVWSHLREAWSDGSVIWVGPDGVRIDEVTVQTGSVQEGSLGFLARQQEIEQLEEQTSGLSEGITEQEGQQKTLREAWGQTQEALEQVQSEQREQELEVLGHTKELEHHQLELNRARQTSKQFDSDLRQLQEEISGAESRYENTTKLLGELEVERQELETTAETQQERIQSQSRRVEDAAEDLLQRRIAFTEVMEQQKTAEATHVRLCQEHSESRQRLQLLDSGQSENNHRLTQSRERIETIDASFGGLLQSRDTLKVELDSETVQHVEQTEQQNELTRTLQAKQKTLETVVSAAHDTSLKLAEFRMQREQLEMQLRDFTEQVPATLVQGLDLENLKVRELSREVQRLKAKLNALGPVNLAAPDEHAALVERLQFLTEQSEDLQKAVDDLKRTIRDINVESRRRFREMFDQVNEHFGEVFTKLFDGGEARMVLTESEDLLDAGIDIVAQPPGKKLQNINLLSGGEKALTAISLIFAIFLIKPSPFCLLDEVDAPLDDANVGRFNNLIRQLADKSQFIIITHNKKTMELGDRLYGVTMEEPGISKTVSVHFQTAERMVA